MTQKQLNRAVAGLVFLISISVYLMTLAPTVVFWDVGEFIAAAKMLQVPHPPGSPLFLLLTRIAVMIPFAADQAVRAHALSALLSALAVMFLYLVIIRVIAGFRGVPETLLDKIVLYGGGVIGALSLAFGTTYWGNSIEAEVYGASMFFLATIMWLVLRWRERVDVEGNEKYILLIAYLIGLSLGVHLLSLLAIFPVSMVVYFRRYEFSLNTFFKFTGVAVAVFLVVYPGIVQYLPGMMDGEFAGSKSDLMAYIPWMIMAAVCYGVYTSYRRKQRIVHIALLSILFVFFGYTTYTSVLIRSNANPPMNENNPSNLSRLTSYLGREQYGNAPLFMPRRWSQEPQHQGIYANYTSDMDFLMRYQLNHMFVRYLGWNYIGAEDDAQDAGVSWKDTFGIPFLIGFLGLYYQFKKDWKMGLVFAAMFVIMGPVLALFQNQQEPQPRERDYFYVGAFFVFSVWIAIGVVAVIDYLGKLVQSPRVATVVAATVAAVFCLAIPGNMARLNWHDHDRSGNYAAWDFAYNLLQSCEQDAILFTYGDNDTFPLWYLQDVEGIRRDVRVVCLSLANTPWYIQQLKSEPYYAEAKAVPFSWSDAQIARIQPVVWEPRKMELPVPPEAIRRYAVTDTAVVNQGKISFMMRNTIQSGDIKAIRVQDRVVQDVIFANQWKRPIYFASGSPESSIGLSEYLWSHGLASRLEPRRTSDADLGIDARVLEANLFHEPPTPSKASRYGFRFRNTAAPHLYFDENTLRMMSNYRWAFIRLAQYHGAQQNREKALAAMDRMEQVLPRKKFPMGWDLTAYIASFYHRLGRDDKFNEIASELEPLARTMIEKGQANFNTYDNPYSVLLEIYEIRKDYAKSLEILKSLAALYPNDPNIQERVKATESRLKLQQSPSSPTVK